MDTDYAWPLRPLLNEHHVFISAFALAPVGLLGGGALGLIPGWGTATAAQALVLYALFTATGALVAWQYEVAQYPNRIEATCLLFDSALRQAQTALAEAEQDDSLSGVVLRTQHRRDVERLQALLANRPS